MATRQSAVFWQDHIEAWRQGSLTQIAYCANHGLHIKSFARRLYQARDAAKPSKLPLTLVPASIARCLTAQPIPINTMIQLHSPSGWRIELPLSTLSHHASGLADLLRQLP